MLVTSAKETDLTTVSFKAKRIRTMWSDMMRRCYDRNNRYYKNYGGKGIVVCEDWKKSFHVFFFWAVRNGYSENLIIDRVNNKRSYNPRNCRFITIEDQQKNRTNNLHITIDGETKILSEWSKITGIPKETIRYRWHGGVRGKELLKRGNK